MKDVLNALLVVVMGIGFYWVCFTASRHMWNRQKRWVVEPACVARKYETRRHSNRRHKYYHADFVTPAHVLHMDMSREMYDRLEVGYTGLLVHKHTGCHHFIQDACTPEELAAVEAAYRQL